MGRPIFTHQGNLKKGKIVERPNRFTLIVEIDSGPERVYLANPGALRTVIEQRREVLCEPTAGENRKTEFNAFAIQADGVYVTVNSAFASTIFSKVLEKGHLSGFARYTVTSSEPPLPDHGRTDFLLKNEEDGTPAYVEVKSCTHVENGIAKFPDRPTERGRRYLKSLTKLARKKWKVTSFLWSRGRTRGSFSPSGKWIQNLPTF